MPWQYCLLQSPPAAAGTASIAHDCTSGGYADPKGYISWRLLDLPSTCFNNLAFVPAGTQMQVSVVHISTCMCMRVTQSRCAKTRIDGCTACHNISTSTAAVSPVFVPLCSCCQWLARTTQTWASPSPSKTALCVCRLLRTSWRWQLRPLVPASSPAKTAGRAHAVMVRSLCAALQGFLALRGHQLSTIGSSTPAAAALQTVPAARLMAAPTNADSVRNQEPSR